MLGRTSLEILCGIRINQCGTRFQILIRQKMFDRHIGHVIEIGDIGAHIGERQFHRLNLKMQRLDRVGFIIRNVGMTQNAQGNQGRNPLPVWRDFMQFHLAKALRDRANPVGLVIGKVVFGKGSPIFLGKSGNFGGQFTPVKAFALGLGNINQAISSGFIDKQLTGLWRLAAGQERLGKTGLLAKCLTAFFPQSRNDRGNGKATRCIFNSRFEQFFKRQFAKFIGNFAPCGNGTRRCHRFPTALGHFISPGKPFRSPCPGRTARCIQPMQFLAIPNDGIGIRSQTITGRLHHGQCNGRCQRGIRRIAPGKQHAQTGLCGQGLGRGNDVARQNR